MGRTMLDRIWESHTIASEGDETLLYVDRTLVHEGSFHAFDLLAHEGKHLRRADLTFGFADHYVPTARRDAGLAAIQDDEARNVVSLLARNAQKFGFQHFGPHFKLSIGGDVGGSFDGEGLSGNFHIFPQGGKFGRQGGGPYPQRTGLEFCGNRIE